MFPAVNVLSLMRYSDSLCSIGQAQRFAYSLKLPHASLLQRLLPEFSSESYKCSFILPQITARQLTIKGISKLFAPVVYNRSVKLPLVPHASLLRSILLRSLRGFPSAEFLSPGI